MFTGFTTFHTLAPISYPVGCSDALPINTSDFRRVLMTPATIPDRISAITEQRFEFLTDVLSKINNHAVCCCADCTWTPWPWRSRHWSASKCRGQLSDTSQNALFFVWDQRLRLKIVSLSSTSWIKILCDGYVKTGSKFLSQSIKSQHLRNLGAFTYCITGVGSNLIFSRTRGFVM